MSNDKPNGLKIDMTITGQQHQASFEYSLLPRRHRSFSNKVPLTIGGKKFTLTTILQPDPLVLDHDRKS